MLATVLRSDVAIKMSVFVVRAFVEMRRILSSNEQLSARIDEIEKRTEDQGQTIKAINQVIQNFLQTPRPPFKEIKGFRNK